MEQELQPKAQRPDYAAWVRSLRENAGEDSQDAQERTWVPLTKLETR